MKSWNWINQKLVVLHLSFLSSDNVSLIISSKLNLTWMIFSGLKGFAQINGHSKRYQALLSLKLCRLPKWQQAYLNISFGFGLSMNCFYKTHLRPPWSYVSLVFSVLTSQTRIKVKLKYFCISIKTSAQLWRFRFIIV